MVLHNIAFPKTHDVGALVALAAATVTEFSAHQQAAARITPFATAFRYPGILSEPTDAEYQQAFRDAREIYRFVCAQLPDAAKP
jgi:hypothetical protein